MRGTGDQRRHGKLGRRITPACAGNSTPWGPCMPCGPDHPRVCGEQHQSECQAVPRLGSPPRVRGTVQLLPLFPIRSRITPACAGNSLLLCETKPLPQDHPRVCGEQWIPCSPCGPLIGSPPRVRGTVVFAPGDRVRIRITPACAGNSAQRPLLFISHKDHPRVCGEQVPWASGKYGPQGSPPRVRGTVPGADDSAPVYRITPACAGNRAQTVQKYFLLQDHPRVCGEQKFEKEYLIACEGSPPRVRGTD